MQTELVDRARRGDREAFSVLAGRRRRSVVRDRSPHPSRHRTRGGCDPGRAGASLAGSADVARRRAVRCLALPVARSLLRGHRAPPAPVACRGHRRADRTRRARSRIGARRPRSARTRASAPHRRAADDPRSCTSTSACLRPRRPMPSRSPSGPPSPGCITPSRRSGRPSRPTSAARSAPRGRAGRHERQPRPRTRLADFYATEAPQRAPDRVLEAVLATI